MKLFYWFFLLFLIACADVFAVQKLPVFHHRSGVLVPDTLLTPAALFFETTLSGQKKIVCKSCHGIEKIEQQDFKTIDKTAADFFSGGPYKKLTDFCYLCHKKKENTRDNIHVLLDQQHKKIESKCLYCHSEVLKTDKLNKKNNVSQNQKHSKQHLKLRLPIAKMCYGCHLQTPHLNILEHQVIVAEKMLLYMQKQNLRYGIKMPLGKNNRVICVSCHEPHQQGVLHTGLTQEIQQQELDSSFLVSADLQQGVEYEKHPWGKTYVMDKKLRLEKLKQGLEKKLLEKSDLFYQRIKNEVLLRLPAKNGLLCLNCHDFSQERRW
ncbi:MAG: hypothetical protein QM479_14910 [Pseudomonadota bacterium]